MMMFGPVPILVAIPLMLAAYAMPSINARPNRLSSGSSAGTCSPSFSTSAIAIGNIIIVVAVFEIHMLMKPVPSMKPSTMRRGLDPMTAMMPSAMRRCRPHCCIDAAIIMPPRNRKLTGSKYCSAMTGSEPIPSSG